jgi:transposase
MEHTTIAVDLAKSVFQIAISRRPGHVDEEHRLSRERFLTCFAQQPPATIVLEACGSAHHWARELQPLGHVVRLLPAHDVHRYVRRNKTDRTDAKALLEANRNAEIHAVPINTTELQAVASLPRLRSTWITTRTARLNTIRGLLREFGIFIPVGASRVVPHRRELLAEPTSRVPDLLRSPLEAACKEIDTLEENIRVIERQLTDFAHQMATVPWLQTIPGVRLADGHGAGRARWRHSSVRLWAALREFSWPHPEGVFQRVSAPSRRDQQARRRLLADLARAGRPLRPLARTRGTAADRVPMLGAPDTAATRPQHRRGCGGQ